METKGSLKVRSAACMYVCNRQQLIGRSSDPQFHDAVKLNSYRLYKIIRHAGTPPRANFIRMRAYMYGGLDEMGGSWNQPQPCAESI